MFAIVDSNLPSAVTGATPLSITSELIKAGILPAPEKAKETFWSLGADWWKQIIDGRCHKFGSKVFDEGSHSGPIERGYLAGIEKASRYFVENMDRPLTLELYRETHRLAIAHFDTRGRNGAGCSWQEIDHFRSNMVSCSGYPIGVKGFAEVEKDRVVLKEARRIINLCKPDVPLEQQRMIIQQQWKGLVVKAFKLLPKLTGSKLDDKTDQERIEILMSTYEELTKSQKAIAMEEMEKMNRHFEQIAQRLGLSKPFADCSVNSAIDFTITTWYLEKSSYSLTIITEKLFAEFNQNLTNARKEAYDKLMSGQKIEEIKSSYQEAALRLIGQLFAELEWLHPWIDGQGRTDLIHLNGLLCREGLHPCILDFPFYSTSNSLELWLDYLKDGLSQFEKLRGY